MAGGRGKRPTRGRPAKGAKHARPAGPPSPTLTAREQRAAVEEKRSAKHARPAGPPTPSLSPREQRAEVARIRARETVRRKRQAKRITAGRSDEALRIVKRHLDRSTAELGIVWRLDIATPERYWATRGRYRPTKRRPMVTWDEVMSAMDSLDADDGFSRLVRGRLLSWRFIIDDALEGEMVVSSVVASRALAMTDVTSKVYRWTQSYGRGGGAEAETAEAETEVTRILEVVLFISKKVGGDLEGDEEFDV